jgi:cytochrome P450
MPDGSYFLSRYDDCAAVYRDPETWSSDKTVDFRPNLGEGPLYEHHTTSLVFNDPPYHSRVRKLLAPAFTPRALMALQPRIEALVDRLLDRAAARGGMDLIADFAAAVPIQLVWATCWACPRPSGAGCAAGRSPSWARSSRC